MTEERGCENSKEDTWFSLNSVMLLFRAIPRRTQFSEKLEDCINIKYMFNRFKNEQVLKFPANHKRKETSNKPVMMMKSMRN